MGAYKRIEGELKFVAAVDRNCSFDRALAFLHLSLHEFALLGAAFVCDDSLKDLSAPDADKYPSRTLSIAAVGVERLDGISSGILVVGDYIGSLSNINLSLIHI